MSTETPRTWRLRYDAQLHGVVVDGPKITNGPREFADGLPVIELDPILDLLERARLLFPELDGTNLPTSAYETDIAETEEAIEALLAATRGETSEREER